MKGHVNIQVTALPVLLGLIFFHHWTHFWAHSSCQLSPAHWAQDVQHFTKKGPDVAPFIWPSVCGQRLKTRWRRWILISRHTYIKKKKNTFGSDFHIQGLICSWFNNMDLRRTSNRYRRPQCVMVYQFVFKGMIMKEVRYIQMVMKDVGRGVENIHW